MYKKILSRVMRTTNPISVKEANKGLYYLPKFFKHHPSPGEMENTKKLITVYDNAMMSILPGQHVANGIHYELYPGPMNDATKITRKHWPNCSEFLTIKYGTKASGRKAWFHNLPIKERWRLSKLRCIMPQSIGCEELGIPGDVHEGESLRLALNLACEYFGSVLVLIDDLVQRFTYQIYNSQLSPLEAKNLALKMGKEWKERNQSILDEFNIEAVSNWLDYVCTAEFQDVLYRIKSLYENNDLFAEEVNAAAHKFLLRYENRMSEMNDYDKTQAFDLTIRYLLEECTLTAMFSVSPQYAYAPFIQRNGNKTADVKEEHDSLSAK